MGFSPIPHVRIALIGLGRRGMKTLERYAFIPDASIVYIADIDQNKLNEANAKLEASNRPKAKIACGADAWKSVCLEADIDLVYICTDWDTHAEISIYAMKAGKHVAVEVPAARTIEECWSLVKTSEETGKHCFMTENCCYDNFALSTIEMYKQGLLGDITHCEGAYIHKIENLSASWMEKSCSSHGGNAYPTHGIGPIAQLLKLQGNDKMDYLVSLTSSMKCKKNEESKVNTTLIHTQKGVSILLQLDVTTNRPYNRLQTICGTKGFVQKYPLPTIQLRDEETATLGEEAEKRAYTFLNGESAQIWLKGKEMGVPNEMNYTMDYRLIKSLINGDPLDMDVYDAATWSCIAELSKKSAENGSIPIKIPDFTINKK